MSAMVLLVPKYFAAAGAGTDRVESIANYTLAAGSNIEDLTLTGTAISGAGNELANTITGNASNNALSGDVGNDTLIGGAGNDMLLGGGNDDRRPAGSATTPWTAEPASTRSPTAPPTSTPGT